MKTRPNRPDQHIRHRHGPWRATLCTAALLLMSLAPPIHAFVIDDFEHGRKFMLWGTGGQLDWELVGGELKFTALESKSFAAGIYRQHVFELPEGQAVEFNLDLVSANRSDAAVTLTVQFPVEIPLKAADRWGYELGVLHGRVVLMKLSNGSVTTVFDRSVPWNVDPKTVSLTLTRQGSNLAVGVKVVLRDDPQTVIASQTYTDHPGTSTEPLTFVGFGCTSTADIGGAEIVIDNPTCSRDPSPHRVSIQHTGVAEAALAWVANDIVLESAAVQGPWRPCPAPVTLRSGAYNCSLPVNGAARYFRLVSGYHIADKFEGGTYWPWQTTSVIPGANLRPTWNVFPSQGRGRIYGDGTRNEDFMLRWGAGIWYRDCVSTVDIVDWGDAMAGATFGILLRAKPDTDLWHSDTAGLPEQRYAGLLTFKKADNPAESMVAITGPAGAMLKEVRFPAVNPEKQYRLRFWAVGDQLTLELFDLADLETPIQTCSVTDGRISEGMDGLYGTKSAGGTYEVWIDDFMLTGATVY